jgi:sporulation protein YlmC with PRC-barrel domain
VAETTEDEREQRGTEDERRGQGTEDDREQRASEDEREPQASEDKRESQGSDDEREPQGSEEERESQGSDDERESQRSEEEREPQASEEDRKPEAGEEEQKPEEEQESKAPDLPEPEEKSVDDLLGQQVVDTHGVTIGKIEALYIHGQEERASWAMVKTGLVRTKCMVVPLHDAQDDGDQIRVVYEKEWVKEAPEIEPEGNELSDEQADALHGHYGMERVKGLTTEGADDIELSREARDADPPTMNEPPWAVEKYPLPDMERPEGKEPEGEESSGEESSGEESSGEESSGEHSQREGSSDRDSEEDESG